MTNNVYSWVINTIREIGIPSVNEIFCYQYLNYKEDISFINENKINYYLKKGVEENIIQILKPYPKNYPKRYYLIDNASIKINEIKPALRVTFCKICKGSIVQRIQKNNIIKHLDNPNCENIIQDNSSINFIKIGIKNGVTFGCSILGMLIRNNGGFNVEFPYFDLSSRFENYINDYYNLTIELRNRGYGSSCNPSIQWVPKD